MSCSVDAKHGRLSSGLVLPHPMLCDPQLPNTLPPSPEDTTSYICFFTLTCVLRSPHLLHLSVQFLQKLPNQIPHFQSQLSSNSPPILLPRKSYLLAPSKHACSHHFIYVFRRPFSAAKCGLLEANAHVLLVETTPRSVRGMSGRPLAVWLPTVSPMFSPALTSFPPTMVPLLSYALSHLHALPELCAWNDTLPHRPLSTSSDPLVPPHPANLAQPPPPAGALLPSAHSTT